MNQKGRVITWGAKISESLKGRTVSEITRKKIGDANRGRIPSEETRRKMSASRKGHKTSEETRRKIAKAHTGMKMSQEAKDKLRELNKGEKSIFWKGGVANQRSISEYKLWHKAVFERDNWTCVWCGKHGGRIEADHIKPFAVFPELRFAIDNGRTLCHECHLTTDSYPKNFLKRKI